MERRNFYILIVAIMIGISIFWLELYAFVILDINPFENNQTIKISGNGIKSELELTVEELKSEDYLQVRDKEFFFENKIGRQYTEVYSGVSLWSILEYHDLLIGAPEELSFTFLSSDAFTSPEPIELSLAKEYPEQVILAYEIDGQQITLDGPVRSIIDYEVIPDLPNSQFAVKELRYIEINYL